MLSRPEIDIHGKWYGDACGGAFGLELLGERWSLLIVRELMFGGRRFKDLRSALPEISAKVLTERLQGLEATGIVRRVQGPPAAAVQLYELTPWGARTDEILLPLCKWALASPGHDHTLFLSPAAMMMSLRALFDPARAAGPSLSAAIRIGSDSFGLQVAEAKLSVKRGTVVDADFAISAPAAAPVKLLIYGKLPAAALVPHDLEISGDADAAARFIDLFHLPAKNA